jgi:outer membrane protein assembly factor BamD
MFSGFNLTKQTLLAIFALGLLSSCIHKKYDNPISKNTQQPDKVLFDAAMHDIEHGRYEVARISLQTLMNTYESSEYLAKAKLAIADSWFREAGANGLAQAEAEYKDFILFYPSMEESAEAQNRVCEIHYKQMDKSDRDDTQTLRAEDECRQLLIQFPNSKFAPQAAQRLRNIQESLAEHEFVVGTFYWHREMNPAAANRLNGLADQFPLYSRADEALFEAGDAYSRMGPRFRKKAGEMFARVVRDYPLGKRVDDAKKRLQDMEMPVPQADGTALARMKYEQENYRKPGMFTRSSRFMRSAPDTSHAAKEGSPTMSAMKKSVPASVPTPTPDGSTAGTGSAGTTDVTATTAPSDGALDKNPDARSSGGAAQADTAVQTTPTAPLPTNRDKELQKIREKQAKKQAALDKKKKKNSEQKDNSGDTSAPASTTTAPNQPSSPDSSTSNPAAPNTTSPQAPQQQ